MVSLRVLEREQVIQAERRESIDWEHVRLVTIGRLRKQGFDVDRAEELTQAAIVAVYSGNVRISLKRAVKDTFAECYGILHAEVAERGETGSTLPDCNEVESSRHTEQRTAYGSATENARNGIKALRDERRLFDRFGWLISQAVQTKPPEQRLMRYLSEMAYSAYGYCQDTTQLPPNTRRVIELKPDLFKDVALCDRELCQSVSRQFRDCVPFRVGGEREAVLLQMLHG